MPAAVAPSALAVPRSRLRAIADLAMGMDGVYKLYFGESNLPTPRFIKDAAKQAIDEGYTYYTSNAGMPSLRAALARYYSDLHAVELDPNTEIAVTSSGAQAINATLRSMLDPGDEVIVLTPAWPNGPASVAMANAVPVEVPHTFSEGRYGLDFEALERAVTPRTRVVLYTSPSNPLGWTATVEDQQRLLDFTRRHKLWLLADEVYERIFFSSAKHAAPSILKLCSREDAVAVIQSFSKSYCMTGWRLGWLVGRKDLVSQVVQLDEYITTCPAGFTQRAGELALLQGEDSVRDLLSRLRENRDYCLHALGQSSRVTVPVPDGAFYLFVGIEGLRDSLDFCKRLLRETKVGVAPGSAFGAGGEGHVRICFASDRPVLEEAMTRFRRFVDAYDPAAAG